MTKIKYPIKQDDLDKIALKRRLQLAQDEVAELRVKALRLENKLELCKDSFNNAKSLINLTISDAIEFITDNCDSDNMITHLEERKSRLNKITI